MTKAHQIPPAQCDSSYTAAAALRSPASEEFICQEKIDGTRALLQIRPNRSRHNFLTGRRVNRETGEFIEVQDLHPAWRDHAFQQGLEETIVDGEIFDDAFWYFDLLMVQGRSLIDRPLRERLAQLDKIAAHFPQWMRPVRSSANLPEFLKKILAGGGEGVVRKHLNETYGFSWSKIKLKESYDVVILSVDLEKRSMQVGQFRGRELINLGAVAGLSELEVATAAAHVGEVAEIICHSRDDRGRFHKPSLFRWRADKAPSDCVFDHELTQAGPASRKNPPGFAQQTSSRPLPGAV